MADVVQNGVLRSSTYAVVGVFLAGATLPLGNMNGFLVDAERRLVLADLA